MPPAALLLLSLLSRRAPAGEAAYQRARHAFYVLKADPSLRRDRDRWLGAAAEFEAVAARFPRSERAPEALYTAAELRGELSRISLSSRDRRRALGELHEVAQRYPKSALADDALFAAARIELDRENDPRAARADLGRLLRAYPRGDMARRARKLLASLPAEKAGRERGSPRQGPAVVPRPDDETAALGDRPKPVPAERASLAARPDRAPGRAEHGRGALGEGGQRLGERPQDDAPDAGAVAELRRAGGAPGGVPLSVQMGLAVRRVIIDAGHGGRDTGAVGPGGTREKNVTLAIARRLAAELRAKGLEVLLTRDDDEFVPLEERARFANEHKGDLFVSIHANAAVDHRLRGIETYFLDVTSDRYAIRLAARENQSTERSISDLQLMLADLAQKAHVEESHRLAASVQAALCERPSAEASRPRDLGVRHALFYVLLGVKMPAILVETAFVSNPAEEKRLRSDDYQAEVAKSIARGVGRFIEERRELAGL